MKKKLIAVIAMVCVAAFALTACGGGGSNTPAGSGSSAQPGGGAAGETFDVGNFTVAVPSGWTTFTQSDIFGEKDADGNYPLDPDQIVIAKGASDEFAALSGPMVRIYHYAPDAYVLDSKSFYDNPEDITGVTVNGTECTAYSAETMGYVYQFVTYETADGKYEINILTSADGKDTGITWQDPDVMTIMESLSAK